MDIIIREAVPSDAEQLITHVQLLAEEAENNIALSAGEFNLTVEEEQKFVEEYAKSDNSIFLVADGEASVKVRRVRIGIYS